MHVALIYIFGFDNLARETHETQNREYKLVIVASFNASLSIYVTMYTIVIFNCYSCLIIKVL